MSQDNSVIWKFELTGPRTVLDVPAGARFVSAGTNADRSLAVWAEVNPAAKREQRVVNAMNTGDQLPPDRIDFIGTVAVPTSLGLAQIVWHVYEVQT